MRARARRASAKDDAPPGDARPLANRGLLGVVGSGMAASPARTLPDPNAPNDPAVEAAFQAVPETMVAEILDGELHSMLHAEPMLTLLVVQIFQACPLPK